MNDGKAAIQTPGFKARGPDGGFFIVWSQGMDFQNITGPETANEEQIFVQSEDVR